MGAYMRLATCIWLDRDLSLSLKSTFMQIASYFQRPAANRHPLFFIDSTTFDLFLSLFVEDCLDFIHHLIHCLNCFFKRNRSCHINTSIL